MTSNQGFWHWTGFADKKLWDFLTPIFAIATVTSAFITIFNQQKNENNRYQEEALTKYIDQTRELLIKTDLKQDKNKENSECLHVNIEKEAQNIARARTISTLQQLNKDRKIILLNFLIQTELVNTDPNKNPKLDVNQNDDLKEKCNSPLISLSHTNLEQVNLSGANLSGADLSDANLSGADLSGADLSSANLLGANLSKANLVSASLKYAVLEKAELQQTALNKTRLREAKLRQANLTGANLTNANLTGTDLNGTLLKEVKGLTTKQVTLANNWQDASYDDNFITPDLRTQTEQNEHKACGQYTTTYIVLVQDNPVGIRCVLFIVSKTKPIITTEIIWYGEGRENEKEYHHIGKVLPDSNSKGSTSFKGYTYNIDEKGKDSINFSLTSNKDIEVHDGNSIKIWKLFKSEQSKKYSPITTQPTTCGSNFQEYKVYPVLTRGEGNPNSDWGIRCVLIDGLTKNEITWFGTGKWEERPYYHLGTSLLNNNKNSSNAIVPDSSNTIVTDSSSKMYTGTSVDICNLLENSFCYDVEPGFLKLQTKKVGIDVTGEWIENWRE